jgi:hypothetical protein
MKPINSKTILSDIVEWVKDFEYENRQLPLSLYDLVNKPSKHDRDLAGLLSFHRENGYTVTYKLSEDEKDVFELIVQYKEEEPCQYKGTVED